MHKRSELLQTLLQRGKERGYLTYGQINETLPDEHFGPRKTKKLVLLFEEHEIGLVDDSTEKFCPGCRRIKPHAKFSSGHGYDSPLAQCCWVCVTKASRRSDMLRKTYHISHHDYLKVLVAQAGACYICRRRPARGLVVDHCHKSGRFRRLLCGSCN
jgi:hypothetical protein